MTNFLKLGVLECAHDGWFKKNLRVSRNTFSWIVDRLTAYSEQHDCFKRGPNAFVDMPMGVAMTLSYLSQESGFLHTASLFGIAKSTAIKVINSILDIIIAMSPQVIKFPGTEGVWKQIGNEFEANCGFPDVAGAVDGTIFQIERHLIMMAGFVERVSQLSICRQRWILKDGLWSTLYAPDRVAIRMFGKCPASEEWRTQSYQK